MSGTSDTIKGRVKEAVGALTGDQRLKNEGKLDQATGKVKGPVERVIDKAKTLSRDPLKSSAFAVSLCNVEKTPRLSRCA